MLGLLAESLGIYFNPESDKYIQVMFDNANTGYMEVQPANMFYFLSC